MEYKPEPNKEQVKRVFEKIEKTQKSSVLGECPQCFGIAKFGSLVCSLCQGTGKG